MRSPSRLPPLNSSTTALSSSLSLSSSFSLSSPSSLSTSSPSLPSYPSLLFWILTVSLLLFHVAASPISTVPQKQGQVQGQSDIRTVQVYVNDTKESSQNNNRSIDCQMDQPPRDIANGVSFPNSWGEQFQKRPVQLRTLNLQYLQIYEGKISGTKEERPISSILFFSSHEMYLVIETLHTEEFLCMNSKSRLYLSKKVTQECYIQEESLYPNGSLAYNYRFVAHSTRRKPLYLGINCHPLLGTATSGRKKSSRFIKDTKLSREKALQIRNEVLRGENSQYKEAPTCKRKPSKRAERRSKMKKMKRRWCLKAARTISNTAELYANCTREFKKECSENSHKKKRQCVCELLMDLLHRTKGKKKCLVDRITRWVVKRNERPNRKFIRHLADLLIPRYSMIMKRLQKGRRGRNKGDAGKVVPTPHPRRHHHGQRGRGKGRRKRKKTVIKLNIILSRYRSQLILPRVSTTVVDTSSAPRSSSSSSSRSSGSSLSSSSSSSASSSSSQSKSNSKRRHPKPNIKVSIDSALKSSSRKTTSGPPRHKIRRHRKSRLKARPG